MIYIVCGLTFGDEGKGTVTDFLTRTARVTGAKTVVRYNGGPQAGHNVVTEDGRWHCFAQLGAGSFVRDTATVLGPRMLVELENLEVEARVLAGKGVEDPLGKITIDPRCALITPMHKMLGQMKEVARGRDRKGTCGMGVGEAARDRRVTVADLSKLEELAETSLELARRLLAEHPGDEMEQLYRWFVERCRPDALRSTYEKIREQIRIATISFDDRSSLEDTTGAVIFEGAQGALLDRSGGFAPYITESRTTHHDATELLGTRSAIKIGVLRAYGHRHGPGPFVTEDRRLRRRYQDPRNLKNRWQGEFRTGHLDLLALRYGLLLNQDLDTLAITGLDRLAGQPNIQICNSYSYTGDLKILDDRVLYERTGPDRARIFAILRGGPETTKILHSCRPADWIILRDTGALIPRLEEELGKKIALISRGPTAADKISTL